MKKLRVMILCVVACMLILNACSGTADKQTKVKETGSDIEKVQLKLSCNDITIESGEVFFIRATCEGDADIPAEEIRWEYTPQRARIVYKNWDWNPITGDNTRDKDPLIGTEFKGCEPGDGELYVVDSSGNIISDVCKITVVENEEPAEEISEEEKVQTEQPIINNKEKPQIIIKNPLPAEFRFMSSSGKRYSACKVHKADVIQKNGHILIELLCEKTYDENMGASAECYFVWKLYDEQNVVVDSGSVAKYNVSVNERFTETIYIFKDLQPGTYNLEFSEKQL